MRVLLLALLAMAIAIVLGLLLSQDPGRLVLVWNDWTVETSAVAFVVLFLAGCIIFYAVVRLVQGLVALPGNIRLWSGGRRLLRTEQLLARGLEAMLARDWPGAEAAFAREARTGRQPLLGLLFAARAAHARGAVARREGYLARAAKLGEDAALSAGLVRADLEIESGQPDLAHSTLAELAGRHGNDARIAALRLELDVRAGRWDAARTGLDTMRGAGVLLPGQLRQLEIETHAGVLRASADAAGLEREWAALPRRLHGEVQLIRAYVDRSIQGGHATGCEALLVRALRRDWDSALVELYGLLPFADPGRAARRAEEWLKQHGRDPILLLTLSRICRQAALWGKARSYLDESIKDRPTATAFLELADLNEQKGDASGAREAYRRGLMLAGLKPGPAPAATLLPAPTPARRAGQS